jgi:hypothetical protein
MSNAPVCHIPPEDANIPQPSANNLPAIPIATDLASALAAVNAIRQTLKVMNNQLPFSNGFRTIQDKKDRVQWSEQSRVIEKVKVYQNNDPSTGNFVEVERINKLVMSDRNTGQTWTWDRERK